MIARRKKAFPEIMESMVSAEPGSFDFLFPSREHGPADGGMPEQPGDEEADR